MHLDSKAWQAPTCVGSHMAKGRRTQTNTSAGRKAWTRQAGPGMLTNTMAGRHAAALIGNREIHRPRNRHTCS
eukprot:2851086-Lingulodinium_polyedra.AAC.1